MAGDPFGISQGLANFFGISVDVAGFIPGTVFTLALLIMLEWTIGRHGSGNESESQIALIAMLTGSITSALFSWYPLWVPFLFALALIVQLMTKWGT